MAGSCHGTQVAVSSNNLGVEGGKALAECLKRNTSITQVRFDYMFCSKQLFVQNSLLISISLMLTSVSSFLHAQLDPPIQMQLDVSKNVLGLESCKVLADAMMNNTSITHFDASGNAMEMSTGAAAFAEMLKVNKTLTWLGLPTSGVSCVGHTVDPGNYVMLADGYASQSDASGGPLQPGDIGNVLSSGSRIKVKVGSRQWNYNEAALVLVKEISAEDAKALSTALDANSSLTQLDMTKCVLGNGVRQALKSHKILFSDQ